MAGWLNADYMRELLRLCAECTELRVAGEETSSHFLAGLGRLTQSQIVLWLDASNVRLDARPIVHDVKDIGWSTPSDRKRVYEYVGATRLKDDPLCASILADGGPLVTRTRAEALTTMQWANSELHNDIHRPAGIDDSLLSVALKPEARASVLCVKRARGEQPYGAVEADFIHAVHAECGWVFESQAKATSTRVSDDWSPRERDVLDLLLTGASEKIAAARLGLSPHTFHGYVKTIYRKLKIGSRAELMALALERAREL